MYTHLKCEVTEIKFIIRMGEPGRQDILLDRRGKRLWVPPAQELGGLNRRIQRPGFIQGLPG